MHIRQRPKLEAKKQDGAGIFLYIDEVTKKLCYKDVNGNVLELPATQVAVNPNYTEVNTIPSDAGDGTSENAYELSVGLNYMPIVSTGGRSLKLPTTAEIGSVIEVGFGAVPRSLAIYGITGATINNGDSDYSIDTDTQGEQSIVRFIKVTSTNWIKSGVTTN